MRKEIKLFGDRVLRVEFEPDRLWRRRARNHEVQESEHIMMPRMAQRLVFHEYDTEGPDFLERPAEDTDGQWPWMFVRRWMAGIPGTLTFGQITQSGLSRTTRLYE